MPGREEPGRSPGQVTKVHRSEQSASIAKITRVSTAINSQGLGQRCKPYAAVIAYTWIRAPLLRH